MVSFSHGEQDVLSTSHDGPASETPLAVSDDYPILERFLLIASLLCGLYVWLAGGNVAASTWIAALVFALAAGVGLPLRRGR